MRNSIHQYPSVGFNGSFILFVLLQWFRDELSKEECMPEEVLALLFNHIDPIYEYHTVLLKDIEHRLAAWLAHCFILSLSFHFNSNRPPLFVGSLGKAVLMDLTKATFTGSAIYCSK